MSPSPAASRTSSTGAASSTTRRRSRLLVESLPAILQCAIAPVPDERLGERACCYVVLRPGESVTLEAICDFLLGHGIAKFKLPERLEVVEEMPLTPTRKVIKGRLQAPRLTRRGRDPPHNLPGRCRRSVG